MMGRPVDVPVGVGPRMSARVLARVATTVSIWCAACPAVFSGPHGPAPGARKQRSAGSSCRSLREYAAGTWTPHPGTPCPN